MVKYNIYDLLATKQKFYCKRVSFTNKEVYYLFCIFIKYGIRPFQSPCSDSRFSGVKEDFNYFWVVGDSPYTMLAFRSPHKLVPREYLCHYVELKEHHFWHLLQGNPRPICSYLHVELREGGGL